MSTLFAFLASAVGPLAIKILLALGVTAITFTGVETVVSALTDHVITSYGGFSGEILALVNLAGLGQGVGLVLGAINSRLALWLAASATRWVVNPA